jgi:perosamine synthetase
VHNLGNIINVPKLKQIYKDNVFIEDNCEGFGGYYGLSHSGTESFCSAMSFFGNKNVTCGEGGAVMCQNEETLEYITKIHGQGQTDVRYIHDTLGYNYRMTNIQASILYGQLLHWNEIRERKNEVFSFYRNNLKNIDNIHVQKIEDNTTPSNWMMGIRVKHGCYSKAQKFFNGESVDIRPMFYPMSSHAHLQHVSNKYKETTSSILSNECFMLPSYPELTISELTYIVDVAKRYSKSVGTP